MSLENHKKTGLGKKIDSHEFDFDPAAWKDMEALLDGKKPSRKFFLFILFLKIFGGFMIFTAATLFLFSTDKSSKTTQHISEIETPTSITKVEATQNEINYSPPTDSIVTVEKTRQQKGKAMKAKTQFSSSNSSNLPNVAANSAIEDWSTPYIPDYVWRNVDSNFVENLGSKLITANQNLVNEKVYLQLNKTIFESNESILFSAFTWSGRSTSSPTGKSFEIAFEHPNGEVLKKTSIAMVDGFADGTFPIPEEIQAGAYNLKVYRGGQNEKPLYQQVVSIFENGEEISSTSSNSNQINLQFFPEGGNWVEGLPTKIAFKAANEFGNPVDIDGVILDENSQGISKFSSYHEGIGTFEISAQADTEYSVKITSPKEIDQIFRLPEVSTKGFAIRLESEENGQKTFKCTTTENEVMKVVVRANGKIIQSKSIFPPSGFMDINTSVLPNGIAQITIFDSYHVPHAERLFFVKNDETLNVKITPNKEKYSSGEKVVMSIDITDQQGKGVPGNFSLVISDQKLYQGNIASSIFLESELNNEVPQSDFYFKNYENKAPKNQEIALDHLMLTSNWNRIPWESVLFSSQVGEIANPSKHQRVKESIQVERIPKTIYWNPSIKTDQNGQATIEFTATKANANLEVRLEGIGTNGQVGFENQTILIEK